MTQTIDQQPGTALAVQGAASVPAEQVKLLAERMLNNKGLFADDMTEKQAMQMAMIAVAYGLDPLAGEVVPYEGKPLITLDGRIRVCADHPMFDGIEDTRPATDDERKAFRVKETEDMWVARVWRKGVRFPSVGYGRAGGGYERNVLVKGNGRGYDPGRGPEMARKRAIVNALRLMFPMPRPRIPGMERELEALPYTVENAAAESGQVIEGVARILPAETSAIHAAAKKVGYSDEGYRDRLQEMFGVRSSQELNQAQAQAAIAAFTAEASKTTDEAPPTYRTGSGVDDSLSRLHENIAADAAEHAGTEPRIFTPPRAEMRRVDPDVLPPPDAPQPTESQVTANSEPTDLADIAAAQFGGTVTGTSIDTPAPPEMLERITVLLGQLGIDGADVRAEFKIPPKAKLTLGQADAIKAWLEKKRAS